MKSFFGGQYSKGDCGVVQGFLGIPDENIFWLKIHDSDKLAYN